MWWGILIGGAIVGIPLLTILGYLVWILSHMFDRF